MVEPQHGLGCITNRISPGNTPQPMLWFHHIRLIQRTDPAISKTEIKANNLEQSFDSDFLGLMIDETNMADRTGPNAAIEPNV